MISSKKLLALSVLLATSLLTSAVFWKKADANQAQTIGLNTDAERNRELLWVYNADNVAHEVGDVVVWTDGSISDGVEITTTTTGNNGLVAGVVAMSDIPATTWGFIQTHGYHSGITITGSVAAGDSLVTSGTGEAGATYTIAQATGTAANQAIIRGVFAAALASDSGGVVKGFIYR